MNVKKYLRGEAADLGVNNFRDLLLLFGCVKIFVSMF